MINIHKNPINEQISQNTSKKQSITEYKNKHNTQTPEKLILKTIIQTQNPH